MTHYPIPRAVCQRYLTLMTLEFQAVTEQLKLSEFVQSQTAQNERTEIVQMASAQKTVVEIPRILYLTTFSNHIEILNRCRENEERVFYMLYSAQHHLT